MTWSIYKDSTRPYKDWERCYTAWFVDEDIETNHYPNKIKFLHDGYVDIHFGDYGVVTCKVTAGCWDHGTEQKIVEMTRRTYHGECIEGFYRTAGKIYVTMGS